MNDTKQKIILTTLKDDLNFQNSHGLILISEHSKRGLSQIKTIDLVETKY